MVIHHGILVSVEQVKLAQRTVEAQRVAHVDARLVTAALLRGDKDDPRRTARTIDGRSESVLQYFNGFDVLGIQRGQRVFLERILQVIVVIQGAAANLVATHRSYRHGTSRVADGVIVAVGTIHRHPVDDIERVVVAHDGTDAADGQHVRRTQRAGRVGHIYAGSRALQHLVHSLEADIVLGLHGGDGTRQVAPLLLAVAHDHYVAHLERLAFAHREVDLVAVAHRHGCLVEANQREGQHVALLRFNLVCAVLSRADRPVGALHVDQHRSHRLPVLVHHAAANHALLRPSGQGQAQEQHSCQKSYLHVSAL